MYKGVSVIFPVGKGGLNTIENVYNIPIKDLVVANNIRYKDLSWRKSPGLQIYDENAIPLDPTCLAGYDWRPDGATKRQVTVWNNGDVYKETGGDIDSVTLASGLTFVGPITLVQGGDIGSGDTKKLFLFSKNVAPIFLDSDGVTMDPITAESIDWSVQKPSFGIYHDARVYASGLTSAPHSLYVSTLLDHGDFAGPNARIFDVQPGCGDIIVAAFSYLPQNLIVFKYPCGIFSVDTTDVTGFFLPSTLIRDDIGMAGPNGVCKVGTDVCFISNNGKVYSLNSLRPDIDPRDADLTAQLNLDEYIIQNIDAGRLNNARLIYDESRKELLYIYTSKNSTVNDSILILDMNDIENGIKASNDNKGEYYNAVWSWLDSDGFRKILCAGVDGLVYKFNSPNRAIGTSGAYTGEFQYAFNDLSVADPKLAGVLKRFDMIQFTLIPTGAYLAKCDIYVDGVFVKTETFNLGEDLALFDDADFDDSTFGGLLSIKRQIPVDATGDQISFRVYNENANEDFNFSGITLFLKPLSKTYENV